MKKRLFIFIGLLDSILRALPLYAQESCYAQYLREHNMRVLTAEDADDSYDELKKAVLAWQLYGSEASLPFAPKEEPAAPKQQDTTCVIVHLTLVDSTWYMWMSVDPLADKYPENTPYMYCLGNPIIYYDPDGQSTYTDVDGNVTEVYDDNDCGVYRWNPQTKQYDKMGESWHPLSFCDQRKYNEQGIVSPKIMKIDFGSSELGDAINAALSENPSLIQYAKNAKSGGIWDLKAHYTNGSMVNGKYASPRDAGNMLAGAVKYRSGMLAPIVQYGYGAYNLSGNCIWKTAALILGNIGIMSQNIPVGVSAAKLICNGEDKLSQKSINIGYKNIR